MPGPIHGFWCCVPGCVYPRRKAGNGRSRFCQRHHHEFYVGRFPEKMARKRELSRIRAARLREEKS